MNHAMTPRDPYIWNRWTQRTLVDSRTFNC